ncbi:hypothetical protein V8E54_008186 [Elaphomyces granulatus]
MNSPSDLGSNAALYLLKSHVTHRSLLMRVSSLLRNPYTVDVRPHQQLPNCGRSLSQSRDRLLEYGLRCPSAQSLKCQSTGSQRRSMRVQWKRYHGMVMSTLDMVAELAEEQTVWDLEFMQDISGEGASRVGVEYVNAGADGGNVLADIQVIKEMENEESWNMMTLPDRRF